MFGLVLMMLARIAELLSVNGMTNYHYGATTDHGPLSIAM